jgi:hypothetical protein
MPDRRQVPDVPTPGVSDWQDASEEEALEREEFLRSAKVELVYEEAQEEKV